MKKIFLILIVLIGAVSFSTFFSKKKESVIISVAGATFPYPIYSKWFHDFNSIYPKYKITYQSIGSGGGIRQVLAHTVSLGASDAIVTADDLQKADSELLHIPTVLGAVVISYNLPHISGNVQLKLSMSTLSKIFLGEITKWNDAEIQEINQGIPLPDHTIQTVHRSDGSGTTYIFSEFLSKISEKWNNIVGTGKSLEWPNGIGGKGNEGVCSIIKQIEYSIGYCEYLYAKNNSIPYFSISNKSGNYIAPSTQSIYLATSNVDIPDDFKISLTNTNAPEGYPLSSFTWLLVYRDKPYHEKVEVRQSILKFLNWMIVEGQASAPSLGYVPLLEPLRQRVQSVISSLE